MPATWLRMSTSTSSESCERLADLVRGLAFYSNAGQGTRVTVESALRPDSLAYIKPVAFVERTFVEGSRDPAPADFYAGSIWFIC